MRKKKCTEEEQIDEPNTFSTVQTIIIIRKRVYVKTYVGQEFYIKIYPYLTEIS